MAVVLCPFFVQFLDDNGNPLAGGKVWTYAAGTSTPKATYTDFTEAVAAANPVVLDAYGRATIWISGAYKFVLTDSLNNVIRTTDNVSAFSVPAASANAYFQELSGNGVLTAFTLSTDLGTDEKAILVFVNNGGWIPYNPNQFTLTSGGTPAITFAVAPPNAANNIRIFAPSLYLGAASASAAAAATSETNAAASALLASQWASQTSGIVAVTDFSAKAWAIGGTGVTGVSGKGAAKEWATTTGAAVDTSEFSSKEYAVGTVATAGSSKSWATVTGGVVASAEYSSKEYAIGTTVPTGSAKDWSKKTSGTVDGAEWSAKGYAVGATGITGVTGSAKEWASSASKPDGVLESSKTYAGQSAASAAVAAAYSAALTDTSTTSLAIGTGSKVFTVSASKGFAAGQFISAASAANNANYMHGQVTSYTGTTLTINVTDTGGSGTKADWQISISGSQGSVGATASLPVTAAGGTVDVITADFTPDITLTDKMFVVVISTGANTSTTPTLNADGLGAKTITARGGAALNPGDTGLAGFVMILEYNLANTRWELANPAKVRLVDIINGTQIMDGGTVGGTANAITLTPTPALTAYAAKDSRTFLVGATNTGSVTMNVSGVGAVTMKKYIGGAPVVLVAGDLLVNTYAHIIHDGTQYLLLNPAMHAQGADIASATTTVLDTATGDYVNVTGTTAITGVTLSVGREITVKFAGILTFTNGASLILPGAANITTAAGDTAILRGEAAGVVRCVMYMKADGTPVVTPSAFGGYTANVGTSDIVLTNASNRFQGCAFTAAGVQFKLPDATTMGSAGAFPFTFVNTGTYTSYVSDNAGQIIAILSPGDRAAIMLGDKSTAKGGWYSLPLGSGAKTYVADQGLNTTLSAGASGGAYVCCAQLTTTTFVAAYVDFTATVAVKAVVLTITGAGTLAAGTAQTLKSLASLQRLSICVLDATHVCVAYAGTSQTNAQVLLISGTSITLGTDTSVVASTGLNLHLFPIGASSCMFHYTVAGAMRGVVLSISGQTITVNSITSGATAAFATENSIDFVQIDVNTYVAAYGGTTSILAHQVWTLSGTTVTANTAVQSINAVAITGNTVIAYLGNNVLLTAYTSGSNLVGYAVAIFNGSTSVTAAGYKDAALTNFAAQTGSTLFAFFIAGNFITFLLEDTGTNQMSVFLTFQFDNRIRSLILTDLRIDQNYNGGYPPYMHPAVSNVAPGKFMMAAYNRASTTPPAITPLFAVY